MTGYVRLAWEAADRATLAYEAARVYSRPNANGQKPLSPTEFENMLENGVSHRAARPTSPMPACCARPRASSDKLRFRL